MIKSIEDKNIKTKANQPLGDDVSKIVTRYVTIEETPVMFGGDGLTIGQQIDEIIGNAISRRTRIDEIAFKITRDDWREMVGD